MGKNRNLTLARLDKMAIPPGSRVLDIGAGPGTFAIPLARGGCAVTAIEPLSVMREVLIEQIENEGISTITSSVRYCARLRAGTPHPISSVLRSTSRLAGSSGTCCRAHTSSAFWGALPGEPGTVFSSCVSLNAGARLPPSASSMVLETLSVMLHRDHTGPSPDWQRKNPELPLRGSAIRLKTAAPACICRRTAGSLLPAGHGPGYSRAGP